MTHFQTQLELISWFCFGISLIICFCEVEAGLEQPGQGEREAYRAAAFLTVAGADQSQMAECSHWCSGIEKEQKTRMQRRNYHFFNLKINLNLSTYSSFLPFLVISLHVKRRDDSLFTEGKM